MSILKLEPIYKDKIWGGTGISNILHRHIHSNLVGESWDVHDDCLISLSENKFIDEINKFISCDIFPILVKIISAEEDLSIQVHPDDNYSQKYENYKYGKHETWYILDAPKNAELIVGLKNKIIDKQKVISFGDETENLEFNSTIDFNKLEYKRLPVSVGDVIDIPPGLVHAITKGVTLLEIQQNSDITYRIYDYDRGRDLHIEKAKNTIQNIEGKVIHGLSIDEDDNKLTYLVSNKHYSIVKIDVNEEYNDTKLNDFCIITCVGGTGNISMYLPLNLDESIYSKNSVELKMGDSVVVIGKYRITGKCSILKTFTEKEEFILPLLNEYTSDEINVKCSVKYHL